jgi:hypothetical protein
MAGRLNSRSARVSLVESRIAIRFGGMFVCLTRRGRAKAGWAVALLYLACVLAPGLALAFGDATTCPMIERSTTGAAHVHDGAELVHAADVAHQDGEGHRHHAHASDATHDHAGHQHGDKSSSGPCCAMMCISAMAPNPPAVAKPSTPISRCASENFQRLPGEPPPLLYRPPIG